MKRRYCIGVDVHCTFSELAVLDASGQRLQRGRCATTIPALLAQLESVARPRCLVIEEGPLADWLWRSLRCHVEEMVVCNPRRNRLIAQDGDKDDPLDAEKLAHLFLGGYVQAVHHSDCSERALLKQHVALYHDRVRHRVSEGLRIASLLRRYGVFVREKHFVAAADRAALLARLPKSRLLANDVRLLWKGYDVAVAQEACLRRRLVELAQGEEVVRRFVELPGIAWVRAATLFVWLDTPWRFRSKSALWKYLGIGLERRRSGTACERLRVPCAVNRQLKSTILGAAKSAAAQGDNPFADQYRRWVEQGLSPKLARRNVARSLAATLWGLWKNGNAYHPEWVGVPAAAVSAAEVSKEAVGCD
jgi:transposase